MAGGFMRFSRRCDLLLGVVLCVLLSGPGCAQSDNPERAEKHDSFRASAGTASPLPAEGGAADVQTKKILEARAAEVERRLEPLRQAVRADPDNAASHLALGQAAVRAHIYAEGVAHLERAVELDPSVGRLLDLAIGYTFAARLDEAVGVYEQILRVEADFPVALHSLGNIALRRTEYDKAIDYFNRALAAKPAYLLAQLHLADALKNSGQPREAYRAYEKVLALEPENPLEAHGFVNALYGLAWLDLMMGAHERAGRFLQELIRLAPEHEKAYYAYGQVLTHLGRPEEAQKAFDMHLQLQAAKPTTSAATMDE